MTSEELKKLAMDAILFAKEDDEKTADDVLKSVPDKIKAAMLHKRNFAVIYTFDRLDSATLHQKGFPLDHRTLDVYPTKQKHR